MKTDGKGMPACGILSGLLLIPAWFAMDFSPSFTAMFLLAAMALTLTGTLCGMGSARKARRVAGAACLNLAALLGAAAVFVYAAGDDWWLRDLGIAIALGVALTVVSGLRQPVAILPRIAALYGLLCAIPSPGLWPLALGMTAFAVLSGLRKGSAAWLLSAGMLSCLAFLILPSLLPGIGIRLPGFRFSGGTLLSDRRLYGNANAQITAADDRFLPGARWLDEDGNSIQAHGGQVQRMPVPAEDGGTEELYVWVGEDKRSGHTGNSVAVYTSADLHAWRFRGDVLRSVESRAQLDSDAYFTALYAGCSPQELDAVYDALGEDKVIERPKMLYNDETGRYVIWFHSDGPTPKNPRSGYDVGMAGVAVSDSPFGPFRFLGRSRLSVCPAGQLDCYPTSKGEARDMNLFKDADGTGYIVYTSENNKTIYISRLNGEYTGLSADPAEAVYGVDCIRLFPGAMREAPVLLRAENGRYYLMTSSTTGWMSNSARVWSADRLFGSWRYDGNPCQGVGRGITFDTQSTSLFYTLDGTLVYCGDRWNGDELADSRYVWLPAAIEDDRLVIRWADAWREGGDE